MNFATARFDFDYLYNRHASIEVRRKMQVLYNIACDYRKPTIVELGTDIGLSATMFLQVCHENDGKLVSVDLRDCSSVSSDSRFHFVQSDSTAASAILQKYPFLKDGIDVIYIDSYHRRSHVEQEFAAWWPFMKKGSSIIFDDVDPHIYSPGQRKDHAGAEKHWQQINDFVQEVFWANVEDMELRIHYGSTGLAVITKHAEMGATYKKPIKFRRRGPLGHFLAKIKLTPRRLVKSKAEILR